MLAAIPFVVRYFHESASVPFKDVFLEEGTVLQQNLYPDMIIFPDAEYETEANEVDENSDDGLARISLKVEGISEAIQKDICRSDVDVFDFGIWISAEFIPDFLEEINEFM